MSGTTPSPERTTPDGPSAGGSGDESASYLRFGAMIATSVLVMFALKYTSTFALSHVEFSETRSYMALMMGGAMAIIMLLFMLGMYRNTRVNAAIVLGSLVLMAVMLFLVRSQTTVQDQSYMRAMIPHHSIAILTSERAEITDVRVRALANEIILAQRREIDEMQWLLDDIAANGEAETEEEADQRPVPDFAAELSPGGDEDDDET